MIVKISIEDHTMLGRSKMTRRPSRLGTIFRVRYLEPLELTVAALSGRLGIFRQTLSRIISSGLWTGLQSGWDQWNAEHTPG